MMSSRLGSGGLFSDGISFLIVNSFFEGVNRAAEMIVLCSSVSNQLLGRFLGFVLCVC